MRRDAVTGRNILTHNLEVHYVRTGAALDIDGHAGVPPSGFSSYALEHQRMVREHYAGGDVVMELFFLNKQSGKDPASKHFRWRFEPGRAGLASSQRRTERYQKEEACSADSRGSPDQFNCIFIEPRRKQPNIPVLCIVFFLVKYPRK